jgi:gliding motility-associated-like protein
MSVLLIHQGVSAQVLVPPTLHCVSTQGNGNIQLVWSLPNNSCGPFVSYDIYRADNVNGPYTLVVSVTDPTQTLYTDNTVNGNSQTYYYYIVSNYTCPGSSQQSSDTLDNLDPAAPEITYVTVNNGFSELHWNPSPSPETYGYIVYKAVGGSYLPIDTIVGATITTYTDPNNSPTTSSQAYTLAAIDSCGHAGIINTLPHNTILASISVDNCLHKGTVTWTPYNNWTGGVGYYKVFVSYDSQPPVLADSTSALSGSFDYGAQNVCVYVAAYQTGAGFVSLSNLVCQSANPENPITGLFLLNATVASQGVTRLFYRVDSVANVESIFILRSDDDVEYNSIALLDPPTSLSAVMTYDDSTALTDIKSYHYRVVMRDACGNSDTSNVVKTVLLSGNAFSNLSNSVTWDNYYNALDTVLFYNLLRLSQTGWNQIAQNPTLNAFEESVGTLVGDSGTLCYVVETVAAIGYSGINDTVVSRSNELCLDQFVKIGMPNAFAPEGVNHTFKPVLRFTGNKSYQFEIYDRWGGRIFATKDFSEGWDGTHDGKLVPMGAYAYYVLVVDNLGQRNERKGTVLVIR